VQAAQMAHALLVAAAMQEARVETAVQNSATVAA